MTHIAGPDFRYGGRVIQRCMVCGAVLADNLHAAMPLNADGTVPEFPTWPRGELVRVTTGHPTSFVLVNHVDGDPLPADSCIDIA